jgi:hypothetical protein
MFVMSTPKTENMRIWDALGKTDPAHTKQFTRAGGFKGTAIKPMWANKQMTEFFGPCGIGWGHEKPEFSTVQAAGEILVYCTVGLWYIQGITRQVVYGVGGDKVLSQIFMKDANGYKVIDSENGGFKTYPQTDDEAFKKAYTDALSNAMKFIGVAADIHMGLFDDSKYVQQVREEFRAEQANDTPKPGAISHQTAGATSTQQSAQHANQRAATSPAGAQPQRSEFKTVIKSVKEIRGVPSKPANGDIPAMPGVRPRMVVTFLDQLSGTNEASCFDTGLWPTLHDAVGLEGVFLVAEKDSKGKHYINVEDVLSIDGTPYVDGKPAVDTATGEVLAERDAQ